MLVIRLSRIGKKNEPHYRVVLQENTWAPSSKAIEVLGHYNPHTDPSTFEVKEDRVKHWLGHGAQPSATVHNFLVNKGIIKAEKVVTGKAKKKAGEDKKEEVAKEKKA